MDGREIGPSAALDALELFTGQFISQGARVYARLPNLNDGAEYSLSGVIRGPRSVHAQTLPATFQFRDLGPGASLLAEAIVTEPCAWMPGNPFLHDVAIELLKEGTVAGEAKREFGIRVLAADGRSIYWGGKRWVCRGVVLGEPSNDDIDGLIATNATLCLKHPTDDDCATASKAGLPLAAVLTKTHDPVEELRRLARYPAVALAIMDADWLPDDLQNQSRHPLLGQRVQEGETLKPAAWADVLVCDAMNADAIRDTQSLGIPIMLWRKTARELSLTHARQAVDELQRDFAGVGDFAGYVVDARNG
jgi:hypothetical protein